MEEGIEGEGTEEIEGMDERRKEVVGEVSRLVPIQRQNAIQQEPAPDSAADGDAAAVRAELGAAVERYRALTVAAHHDIIPEMVGGDDFAAIDASVARAREAFAAVRARLLSHDARVPAGSTGEGRGTVPALIGRTAGGAASATDMLRAAMRGKRG